MNIYDFSVIDKKGDAVSLNEYKGKVLLVVNTATKCGLTPQYDELQKLYDEYEERGLVILDFPCNQFAEQAPESNEEIHEFCTMNFGTKFPRFAKIDVNGENASPLYKWLKKEISVDKGNAETAGFEAHVKPLTPNNVDGDIKWNFGKFLINKNGEVSFRYSPVMGANDIRSDIEELLK